MENNLILSKESSESEIKRYFNAVLELSKSDNEFPINIDEVWMLVYSRRDYATDALKKDFIENVDYRCTSVKPKWVVQGLNMKFPFPAWSSSSLVRFAQCLRCTDKCFIKLQSRNFPEKNLP